MWKYARGLSTLQSCERLLLVFGLLVAVATSSCHAHSDVDASASSAKLFATAGNATEVGKTVKVYPDMATSPYFISPGLRNITTAVGQTAFLHCRVAQLGDTAQVSWIRKRDLHVLSSGVIIFASDERIQVIHPDKSENWTLQIKYAQVRDSGIYECQVNTEPKISMSFSLNVMTSWATIHGPEYVKAGSTINLTCLINYTDMQGAVFWYHNRRMMTTHEDQVSIRIQKDRDVTTSQLVIKDAKTNHSGNYSCLPTWADPAAVLVNVVVDGEQPAAMQTGSASHSTSELLTLLLLLLLLQSLLTVFVMSQR